MLPQLLKVVRERKSEALSPIMLGVLIVGVGLWTWYGMMKKELPIILSNGFAVVLNGVLLGCYFKFKK